MKTRKLSILAAGFLISCFFSSQAISIESSVKKFGNVGTVKVRVSDPATMQSFRLGGSNVVADYDGFIVVEMPANAVAPGDGVEILPLANTILLNAKSLDTSLPEIKSLSAPRGAFPGKSLHLLQFAGPVQPAWYTDLENTGVQIVTYIPNNAYLVYGTSEQIAGVQALSAISPQIQWDGAYEDYYKIHPVARPENAVPGGDSLYGIQLVEDPIANQSTLALIDSVKLAPISSSYSLLGYKNIVVKLPPDKVVDISQQSEVVSIQPFIMPRLMDERQDQIVAGNLNSGIPTGPGYFAWLGTMGFTQSQFDTSDFAVDVTDSGIDNGTITPNHFGLYVNGIRPGTPRILYNRLEGTANPGSTLKGCDGHGTLNTHVVCGFDTLPNLPFADAQGYHFGLGVCPFTKAGSTVIFDPHVFTFPTYVDIQSKAYNDKARISTNSWGANFNGYTIDCQAYDALVRDAQPSGSPFPAVGNQEMVILFSNGNAGPGGSTVGEPANAKNVISIGAAANVQQFGGDDGCGLSDSEAANANDIALFSSRGPTGDLRKKPDLVAPGTHVSGGVIQTVTPAQTGTADACFDGSGVCGGPLGIFFPTSNQQFYTASTGTSHSTPAVAGGCALIRQFFVNLGMTEPSPAMTKCLLINSARYLHGIGANDQLWSNSQGMGEMNLGEAFKRGAEVETIFRDQLSQDTFTASGQFRTFEGSVADLSKPFRVTLAWTDAPGATSGFAFKNDLDLLVTVGPSSFRGNQFVSEYSGTGGSSDFANNVESVFLPAGTTGNYTVTITASNINSNGVPNIGGPLDQDFALIIYNASLCPTISITPDSLPDAILGQPYNQTLTATGGTQPYTWTVVSGALPTGLTLNADGSITGTQTASGIFRYTIKATDSLGCSGKHSYTTTPAFNMATLTDSGTCGATTTSPLGPDPLVSGGLPPYSYQWSVLQGGSDFDSFAAQLEHPTIKIEGTDDYQVQVVVSDSSNPHKTVMGSFKIVQGNSIVIDPGVYLRYHPIVTLGDKLNFGNEFKITGGHTPYNIAWTIEDNPNGYGTISTPDSLAPSFGSTQPGTYTIVLTVTDAVGCTAGYKFSATVTPEGPNSKVLDTSGSGGSGTPGSSATCGAGAGLCGTTGLTTLAMFLAGCGYLRTRVRDRRSMR